MKLCVAFSVCWIVFLGTCLGQRQGDRQGQRTVESQDNGQQQRGGCSLFQGCLQFPSIPNPIDKFRSKVNFKVGKVRTLYGFKKAIFNLVPAKLQFEIEAIRGAQAFLDAKLAAKTAAKKGALAFNNFSNGIGNVFNRFFPPPPQPQQQQNGRR